MVRYFQSKGQRSTNCEVICNNKCQSQASASELGKELAEVESLLQKQDLLEAQISAHGETISSISGAALQVLTLPRQRSDTYFMFELSSHVSSSQVKVREGQQVQSRVRALDKQYKSLVSLSTRRFWFRSAHLLNDT